RLFRAEDQLHAGEHQAALRCVSRGVSGETCPVGLRAQVRRDKRPACPSCPGTSGPLVPTNQKKSTMTLLHPALLWLLPLAAIPILLHLLTLHRLKTVELSTFRFLFDSYVQQRRRMQFLEALLAMLRTLFLLLLVFLVARPAIRHWNEFFHQGSGHEVILL